MQSDQADFQRSDESRFVDDGAASDGHEERGRPLGVRQDHLSRREFLEAQAAEAPKDPATDVPVELALGEAPAPTMEARLQRYVRYELSRQNEKRGLETFEEFDDFTLPDDDEDELPFTEHEMSQATEEMPVWNEERAGLDAQEAAEAEFSFEDPSPGPGTDTGLTDASEASEPGSNAGGSPPGNGATGEGAATP